MMSQFLSQKQLELYLWPLPKDLLRVPWDIVDSSVIQQHESTDYSTEKVEIPNTASFVDPYNPALFVGKRPLSDDEKMTFLTSKFNCPSNFLPFQEEGFVQAGLQIGHGYNTAC